MNDFFPKTLGGKKGLNYVGNEFQFSVVNSLQLWLGAGAQHHHWKGSPQTKKQKETVS